MREWAFLNTISPPGKPLPLISTRKKVPMLSGQVFLFIVLFSHIQQEKSSWFFYVPFHTHYMQLQP